MCVSVAYIRYKREYWLCMNCKVLQIFFFSFIIKLQSTNRYLKIVNFLLTGYERLKCKTFSLYFDLWVSECALMMALKKWIFFVYQILIFIKSLQIAKFTCVQNCNAIKLKSNFHVQFFCVMNQIIKLSVSLAIDKWVTWHVGEIVSLKSLSFFIGVVGYFSAPILLREFPRSRGGFATKFGMSISMLPFGIIATI